MDQLDRRILREIQFDCSRSSRELAERCATTESTVLRRLRRMRRDGVIVREVALVDPAKVGRNLTIFIGVRLEGEDRSAAENFIRRVRDHPDVMQFYFVTGSPDYLIQLSVRTMEDYDRFLRGILVDDPTVVTSETNVVIRALKKESAFVIDEE